MLILSSKVGHHLKMKLFEKDGLKYFSFDTFPDSVTNAIFTRLGGVSQGESWGLNVGSNVGDEISNVWENKRKIFSALNFAENNYFDCWQVHGPDYVLVNATHGSIGRIREFKADAMLTNVPGVPLFMRFADCTPIMIYDPVQKAVGIAHAGWQGTIKGVARNLVMGFQAAFGSNPKDLIAGIGPSIGPDHYEISEPVLSHVENSHSHNTIRLIKSNEYNKVTFDLWEANKIELERVGVEKIEVSGICTACNTNEWFSHRAERGRTGRFAAIVSLKKN